MVEGLGHAFLMRNYRAGLAKWQTADPMGYPDGWNQLAYCGNGVTGAVDLWGCATERVTSRKGSVSGSTHWRGTLATQLNGFESLVDSFSVSLDYEVVGSFKDGTIDILFSNIKGSWDITLAFESESKDGMSCHYDIGYGCINTTVTYEAERLQDCNSLSWGDDKTNIVQRTIKFNIYESFDMGLGLGLGPVSISTPLSLEFFKVLDAWVDITVKYSEVKE